MMLNKKYLISGILIGVIIIVGILSISSITGYVLFDSDTLSGFYFETTFVSSQNERNLTIRNTFDQKIEDITVILTLPPGTNVIETDAIIDGDDLKWVIDYLEPQQSKRFIFKTSSLNGALLINISGLITESTEEVVSINLEKKFTEEEVYYQKINVTPRSWISRISFSVEPEDIGNETMFYLDIDEEFNGNEDLIGFLDGIISSDLPKEKYTDSVYIVVHSSNMAIRVENVNLTWTSEKEVGDSGSVGDFEPTPEIVEPIPEEIESEPEVEDTTTEVITQEGRFTFEQTRENPSIPLRWSNNIYFTMSDSDEKQWDDTVYVVDNGYSGKGIIYDLSKANSGNYPYLKSKNIKVNPSSSYLITFYVKNDFSGGDPAGYTDKFILEVVSADENNEILNDWFVLWNRNEITNKIGQPYYLEPETYPLNPVAEDAGNGWKKITVTTQPFNDNSAKLALFFSPFRNDNYDSSSGTITIDEVSIIEQ